jgi:hypothetical protein
VASKKAPSFPSWQADDPRRVWFENYSPWVVTPDEWQVVREFVREQTIRCEAPLLRTKLIVKVLAQLSAWSVAEYIDLDVEEVLDPDTCNRWIESPHPDWSPRTRAAYRCVLREMGPKLTRNAPWEPRPETYSRNPLSTPYDEFEIRTIRRDSRSQKTRFRTRAARALVAQGLGAGLDGRWNCKTRGVDIDKDRVGVYVCVPPPMERVVYVRRAFADELLELANLAGDDLLVGSCSTNKNLPNALARNTVIDQGRIALNAARMRSTWIVAQLNAGTHLRVLMDAAGLETLDAIRDLIQYVHPIDADLEAELLVSA